MVARPARAWLGRRQARGGRRRLARLVHHRRRDRGRGAGGARGIRGVALCAAPADFGDDAITVRAVPGAGDLGWLARRGGVGALPILTAARARLAAHFSSRRGRHAKASMRAWASSPTVILVRTASRMLVLSSAAALGAAAAARINHFSAWMTLTGIPCPLS